MPKESVFTMKLEPELRTAFMEAAAREDRPASQIVRELMRGYIEQQQQSRDYDNYLRQKISASRRSLAAGEGRFNADVEAVFLARRNKAKAQDV